MGVSRYIENFSADELASVIEALLCNRFADEESAS